MGWKGGVIGGLIGGIIGLFFKSLLLLIWYQGLVLGKTPPSLQQYLMTTFTASSQIEFIRFFTIAGPFALMGVAMGLFMTKKAEIGSNLQG